MAGSSSTSMRQQRAREATKRHVLGDVTGEQHQNANNVENRTNLQVLMDTLSDSFNKQLESLEHAKVSEKQQQQEFFTTGMIHFNRNTKKMTIAEFNALHKCNLLDVLKSVREENEKAAVVSHNKRGRTEMETPAPAKSKTALPTPSRTVRRGETVVSANGSPVEMVEDGALVATVTKKRRSNNILPAVQLDINVGGGRLISLTDGVPHDLDEAHRSAARDQLEILGEQLNRVMEQLKK